MLDEMRPMLTRAYILRDATTRLQAKTQALVAAIGKGQSMADAAKSVGGTVTEAADVLRSSAGQVYSQGVSGMWLQLSVQRDACAVFQRANGSCACGDYSAAFAFRRIRNRRE